MPTNPNFRTGIGQFQPKAGLPCYGRFVEPDPIGYEDSPNLYAYVGNDPINFTDPLGLQAVPPPGPPIIVTAPYYLLDPIRKEVPLLSSSSGEGSRGGQPRTPKPPTTRKCAGPPPAKGTGMSEDALKALAADNAAHAKRMGIADFYLHVKNQGSWDYKQRHKAFTDFGNYNYGYAGAALGVSLGVLQRQAGRAQVAAGTTRPGWGHPGFAGVIGGSPPYGDDPRDQTLIEQGYNDYVNGCR